MDRTEMTCESDATSQEAERARTQSVLKLEQRLLQDIQILDRPGKLGCRIEQVFQDLGTYLQADRIYIFSIDGQKISNTYEWCREGVEPQIQHLQDLDINSIARWLPYLERQETVEVCDIETIREAYPEEYAVMAPQNIQSYLEAPLVVDEKLIGFIGFDNPPVEQFEHLRLVLHALAYFISAAIIRERHLKREQQQVDELTERKQNLDNYKRLVVQIERLYPESLGSFYLNLTQNKCGKGRSPLSFVLKQQESGTVDGYFETFFKLLVDSDIEKKFRATFNRKKLIEDFHRGRNKVCLEYSIAYPDGLHWRNALLYLIKNPFTGDIEGRTFAVDIDAQKNWEFIINELVGTDYDFVALVNMLNGKVTEYGEKGKNEAVAGRLVEADYTTSMIQALNNFIHPDVLEEAIHAHRLETIREKLAEVPVYGITLPTKDKRVESWRISYLNGNKNKVLIARKDVTSFIEKEQRQIVELQRAKMEADKANQAKSNFLNGMSHDLRTPLNGILGFTDLALRTKDVALREAYLRKIKISGELLADLVNDTLELSRIESGKLVLKPDLVDGRHFWESLVTSLLPAAEMRNIKLETNLESCPADIIKVDQLQVKKLLLNLISNALKYTLPGGRVWVGIEALEHEPHGYTRRLIVQDTGIGMSPEFMTHLYEPFAQEQRAEVKTVLGTGLGLSIVKHIVDLMGGRISVQSKLHTGTRFIVDLPIEHWSKKPVSKEQVQAELERREEAVYASLRDRQVLLCEDNYLNAEIASLLLKDKQMAVDWAKNGRQGVDKFAASMEGYYDLVLMDIRMPELDGYEATRVIRKLQRRDAGKVPIIAMTANAFAEDVALAEQVGMNGYITKPINPQLLYSTMAKRLQQGH